MKILLISDDNEFAENLRKKLVFLRSTDSVVVLNYADASKELEGAQVVLVHEQPEYSLNLIAELRKHLDLCIILIANSYDRESILASVDAGADDFILSSAEDFELVVRIINNIKHNSVKLSARRNEKLLEQLNVVDNGLYLKDYCKQLINHVEGIFIALSPSENAKAYFSYEQLAEAVRTSLRPQDIAFKTKGVNFYVFLPQTDFNGALVVLNKIKQKIDFDICAGISDNKSDVEESALKALGEALASDAEFVFAEEKSETLDEWLYDAEQKNYKFFKLIFNKKLEKVIAPVFYRLQKAYEEKLLETDIEQYTNEEECVFRLKNNAGESVLKIIYPGFAKILIQINHAGLDSPENREIQISLSKITQKDLIGIVEDFIKEFKENVKC